MQCPVCGGSTDVVSTFPAADHKRRRRSCLACYHRFTTIERIEGSGEREKIPAWAQALLNKNRLIDAEAIVAAIEVDRRKAKMHDEQDAADLREAHALREAGYEEEATEIERMMRNRRRQF